MATLPDSREEENLKVTIIIPIHNEEENIRALVQAVRAACNQIRTVTISMIFVDDGSTDQSLNIVREIMLSDKSVGYIKFISNFGHQAALEAGLDYADSDAIITMDGDLQHPPSELPNMIESYVNGALVVQMVRNRSERNLVGYISKFYHLLINMLDKNNVIYNGADFRLISKKVLDVIRSSPEKGKLLRALVPALNLPVQVLYFDQKKRERGVSSYKFSKLVELAINPLFKYTTLPLKLFTFGFIAVLAALTMIIIFASLNGLITNQFSTILILIMGMMTLLGIIILGKYIVELHFQSKKLPSYIIEETSLPA